MHSILLSLFGLLAALVAGTAGSFLFDYPYWATPIIPHSFYHDTETGLLWYGKSPDVAGKLAQTNYQNIYDNLNVSSLAYGGGGGGYGGEGGYGGGSGYGNSGGGYGGGGGYDARSGYAGAPNAGYGAAAAAPPIGGGGGGYGVNQIPPQGYGQQQQQPYARANPLQIVQQQQLNSPAASNIYNYLRGQQQQKRRR